MRIVWLFLLGEGYWVKLLPLHLCGLQVLFIPLAVFTRSEALRSYVWATSILGGITAIVYPAGIVGTYPFFHFQTFQSFALHLLLILVPILMFLCDGYAPSIKQLPSVTVILSLGALWRLRCGLDLGTELHVSSGSPGHRLFTGDPALWRISCLLADVGIGRACGLCFVTGLGTALGSTKTDASARKKEE